LSFQQGAVVKIWLDDLKHMVVVTDLRVAFPQRIIRVGMFIWNLLKHRLDERVDTGVVLDEIFELDQNGVQVLGIPLDVVDDSA